MLPLMYYLLKKREKARVVYYGLGITLFTVITNLMKLLYADPRPFWSSDNIKAFHCSSQYGNPSGHTLFCVALPLLIVLDLNDAYQTDKNNRIFNIVAS